MWHSVAFVCHCLFLISFSFGVSGRAVLHDCGISWIAYLIYFLQYIATHKF